MYVTHSAKQSSLFAACGAFVILFDVAATRFQETVRSILGRGGHAQKWVSTGLNRETQEGGEGQKGDRQMSVKWHLPKLEVEGLKH